MKLPRAIVPVLGALALAATMSGTGVAAEPSTRTADAAGQAPVTFGASAWGSTVKIAGPLVNSGKTAFVSLGCTQRDNISRVNSTAGVEIPGLLDLGAVRSTATTDRTGGPTYTSTGHSTTASASLLEGEIEVGAIEANASTSKDDDGFSADVEFDIASLTIGGEEVEIGDDEQTFELEGLATITINKEKTKVKNNRASASGTAVTIEVLDTGAVIKLGEARAKLDGRIVNGFFGGGAYGTKLIVAGTVESGKTANQPLGCLGTRGKDKTNEVATVDLEDVAEVNGIVSTVNGDQTPNADANVSNEITEVQLLGGLAAIEAITTSVHVFEDENGEVDYEADADIGSIRIGILEIDLPTEAGETIDLPGIGELTFMEVTELANGRGVEVIGARIVLDDGETEIVLSRSKAVIKD